MKFSDVRITFYRLADGAGATEKKWAIWRWSTPLSAKQTGTVNAIGIRQMGHEESCFPLMAGILPANPYNYPRFILKTKLTHDE